MTTVGPISIAAESDDGQISTGWTFYDTGGDGDGILWAGDQGGVCCYSFLRFVLGTAIPSGSTIDSATLDLYGRGTYIWSDGADDLYITASDADSPSAPSVLGTRPSESGGSVTTTTADVLWANISWVNPGWNTSPDIKSIIQELADSGYLNGTTKSIIFWLRKTTPFQDGIVGIEGTAYGGSSNVPKLTINFTSGGATSITIFMNQYRQRRN
jgi:hypothetical protein